MPTRAGILPTLIVLVALVVPSACTQAPANPERERTLATLAHGLAWLEKAPPDPGTAFGFQCLDAWTWSMFAAWHPDERVRHQAAAATDARLAAIRPPPQWTVVTLSYWSLALRLMAARELPLAPSRAALADVDLTAALATATPTTRWWTLVLLQQAGVPVAPDPAGTFVATYAATGPPSPVTVTHAYNVYHEIVPAAGLALAPLAGLSAEQIAFATAVTPTVIEVAMRSGDTDAVAEALVTAAVLGLRDRDEYRTGLGWLLDRHNGDGTFRSTRDASRAPNTDHYRHVVLVGSFALLTSLERYEPAGRR